MKINKKGTHGNQVRIDKELHKKLKIKAVNNGWLLQHLLNQIVFDFLYEGKVVEKQETQEMWALINIKNDDIVAIYTTKINGDQMADMLNKSLESERYKVVMVVVGNLKRA